MIVKEKMSFIVFISCNASQEKISLYVTRKYDYALNDVAHAF